MRRSDVVHLQVGDFVFLKHNLGYGPIVAIALAELEGGTGDGRYPMIQYTNLLNDDVWCTYLVIKTYTQPDRRIVDELTTNCNT